MYYQKVSIKKRNCLNSRINSLDIMLFLYINLSLVQIITARIGRLTSQPVLVSNILSQIVLGAAIVIYYKKQKYIRPISIWIPLLIVLLFVASAIMYPNRADSILSVENGIWSVLAFDSSLFGFFIVVNLKDYMKLEKIMMVSIVYQLPLYFFNCYRTGKRGYWTVIVGDDIIKSSYNMSVGYAMSFLAIMMLYLFYKSKNIIWLLICGILEFLIVLFGSRGALLPPVVYLLAWMVISYKPSMSRNGLKKIGILLLSVLCMALLIYNIKTITSEMNEFFKSINYYSRTLDRFLNGDVGDASSRTNLWNPLIEKLKNNDYFPLGLYADREYVDTYSHNMLVEIVSNFGVFGIIIGGVITYLTIKFFVYNKDEQEKMFLLVFLIFSVTKLMLSSSFWLERYFWVYLALLFVGIKKQRKKFTD